jgi:YidC/Oxa1 family membrane protein insertase
LLNATRFIRVDTIRLNEVFVESVFTLEKEYMEFDKKTVLAFVLIGLLMIFLQTDFYKKRFMPPVPPPSSVPLLDSTDITRPESPGVQPEIETIEPALQPSSPEIRRGVASVAGDADSVTVETALYKAVLSTRGACVQSWSLKEYSERGQRPVQLIGEQGYGNLAVLIPSQPDSIDTAGFIFSVNKRKINLTEQQEETLEFVLDLGDGKAVIKRFVFYRDSYSVTMEVELRQLDAIVDGYTYGVTWRSGLRSTEPDIKMDMDSARLYAFQGDAEAFDADDTFDAAEWDNPTDWIAIKNKYFTIALIAENKRATGVTLFAEEVDVGANAPWKKFGYDLNMPFEENKTHKDRFTLYLGPLDLETVEQLGVGLEKIMDLGPAIFRPFAWIILWSFTWLHKIIPNYGFVIVVFSILVKVVLFPLTKKSYKSMKEMQALQPVIQELNEKYKDDPQKKQQEMMSIYKEYGINPLGGCIPMVLQMPLLFALFSVFRSTIELRGATFIWWIQDLSRPDTVGHLPFSIPMYGDSVNILPLFMGVTMFIQQKMTMKDPKQKAMVYFMPLFLTLLFNSFPSGLNLYYALFNLFSIIQEKFIPMKIRTPEEMKKTAQDKKAKGHARKRRPHDYRGRR